MGMLGGFLKQMNDSIKYNRALLKKNDKSKSKQIRDAFKDEVRNRSSSYENVNLDELKKRVRNKLQRNKTQEILARALALSIIITLIIGLGWLFSKIEFTVEKPVPYSNKSTLFKTLIYPDAREGYDLKIDFYNDGPKAAETLLKDGLKHQNSESYYLSGEQFRSALYYKDTLIREIYFYKTGDTIKNFPVVNEKEVFHIKLHNTTKNKVIEFDLYDGKIISGSYREKNNEK